MNKVLIDTTNGNFEIGGPNGISVTSTTTSNAVEISALAASNALVVTGNTYINGTLQADVVSLSVTEQMSLAGWFDVSGTTTLNKVLIDTTNGNFEIGGPNGISLTSTTTSNAVLISSTSASNALFVTGNTTLDGDLTVIGETGLEGDIDISGEVTADALSVTNNVTLGDSNADELTVNAVIQGKNPLVFEGETSDSNELTLTVTEPSEPRRITLPDASGTVVLRTMTAISASTPLSRTLTPSDQGVVLISSTVSDDVTLTLPQGDSRYAGVLYTIKKTNTSDNKVYISGNVDGQTMQPIYFQYAYVTVICDGNEWFKVAEYPVSDEDPEAGGGGTVNVNDPVSITQVTINWAAAADSWSPEASLEYLGCMSSTAATDIDSISECQANSVGDWTSDTAMTFEGLTSGETYYFNVIVRDEGGSMTLYNGVSSMSPLPIVLYSAGTHNGNLGGRSGADTICSSAASGALTNLYSNFKAFVSFSTFDEIIDMPSNYTIPSGLTIKSETGVIVASNWADLTNTQNQTVVSAGVMLTNTYWWSGTISDASYYTSCSGFTTSDSGTSGRAEYTGFATGDTTKWMLNDYGSGCNNQLEVICVAW
ncbi:hypothetical protein GMMP1_1190001 [Candidatus Magnetomoraceae bacterium gMMP-1]